MNDKIELQGLDITAKGMKDIYVPLLRYNTKETVKISVTVWDSLIDGAVDQVLRLSLLGLQLQLVVVLYLSNYSYCF